MPCDLYHKNKPLLDAVNYLTREIHRKSVTFVANNNAVNRKNEFQTHSIKDDDNENWHGDQRWRCHRD